MSIISLFLVIVISGVLLWLVNRYIPMEPSFKTVMNVLACIVLVLWVLYEFGLIGGPVVRLR